TSRGEDGHRAKRGQLQFFGAADPHPVPLDLLDVRQTSCRVSGDPLETDQLAFAQLGSGTLQDLGDLLPSTDRRAMPVGGGGRAGSPSWAGKPWAAGGWGECRGNRRGATSRSDATPTSLDPSRDL